MRMNMEISTSLNYYKVTGGKAMEIIQQWRKDCAIAHEKNLEFSAKFGGYAMVQSGCSQIRGVGFKHPKPTRKQLEEWGFCINPDRRSGMYSPRSTGKNGKSLCKEFSDLEKLCKSREAITQLMFDGKTNHIEGLTWYQPCLFTLKPNEFFVNVHKSAPCKPIDGLELLTFEQVAQYAEEYENQHAKSEATND